MPGIFKWVLIEIKYAFWHNFIRIMSIYATKMYTQNDM